jgi:hypothetical protein
MTNSRRIVSSLLDSLVHPLSLSLSPLRDSLRNSNASIPFFLKKKLSILGASLYFCSLPHRKTTKENLHRGMNSQINKYRE